MTVAQTTEDAIRAFKAFVRKHPELIKGVKEQGKTWKDVFDEWVLFGEDHKIWEAYGLETAPKKKPPLANEFMRLFDMIGNLDAESIQKRLGEINGALDAIQSLLQKWPSPASGAPANSRPYASGQLPAPPTPPYPQPPYYYNR